tara:strand:- start:292 stop:567 length:276 start_codon:yes stop_codon:yes gene_type:complete
LIKDASVRFLVYAASGPIFLALEVVEYAVDICLVGIELSPIPFQHARMQRLFEYLATARPDGRFPKLIDKLARVQHLVLDDWAPTAKAPTP